MAKALTDHPDWCLWLNKNIRRGCDHTALVETLLKNGFDETSIRIVLDGRRAFAGSESLKLLLTTPPQRSHDRPGLTMGDGPFLVSQVLTEKLQLYILPEFLSTRECQDIVAVGSDQLRASMVSFPDRRKNNSADENKDTSLDYVDPSYRTSVTAYCLELWSTVACWNPRYFSK
jgi:hypothetical protein